MCSFFVLRKVIDIRTEVELYETINKFYVIKQSSGSWTMMFTLFACVYFFGGRFTGSLLTVESNKDNIII